MYPFILPNVFGYNIVVYDILVLVGVFAMLFYVAHRLEKQNGYTKKQTNRLLILIVISLLFALLSSYLFDGIFHSIKNGEWTFGTITFLGGLVGGVSMFLILMKYFYTESNKNIREIMNTILVGVVLAHAFGRIGCFFAGCCFGIPTDSFLGVVFPHGHAHSTYPGVAVLPTQLFEAFFLFSLFVVMNKWHKVKHFEIETYLIGYGIWRILIEFIRGDDRGVLIELFTTKYNVFPTPSQLMSVGMVAFGIYLVLHRRNKSKNSK
jgi:phosphatidylglycerol:prolipoprotein diacylglycerol transferase